MGLYSLVFSLFEAFIIALIYYQRRRFIVAWNQLRDATVQRVSFSKGESGPDWFSTVVYLVTPVVACYDCKNMSMNYGKLCFFVCMIPLSFL